MRCMNFGWQTVSAEVMASAHHAKASGLQGVVDVLGADFGFAHRAPVSVLPLLGLGR